MLSLWPSRAVALELFGLEVRWYGLLYVVAFGLAWWLLPRLQGQRDLALTGEDWLYVLAWSVAGVLVGGRLGYALFYEFNYFSAHPLEVLYLWQGGMSSHGGFIGVGLALYLTSKRLKLDWRGLADVAVVPAAWGLALGRVGNWINGELFVSDLAHGLAVGKDLLLTLLAWWLLQRRWSKTGQVAAWFLIGYAGLRFWSEFWRQPDWPLILGLTRGQLLTLPILAAGVLLELWRRQSVKKLW